MSVQIRAPGRTITIGDTVFKMNKAIFAAGGKVGATPSPEQKPTTARPARRIRQNSKPLMNKLEQEYFDLFLRSRTSPVMIQSVRFKLGNGIWYKPDFFTMSMVCASCVAIEVKGPHAFRGGFENLKVAAHLYPYIKWVLVWKVDRQWHEQTISP